jgi:hypothetical protein
MVSPNIKLAKMIIKCKGKHAQRPIWKGVPPFFYIINIPNFTVIHDVRDVIKLKGADK